MWLWVGGVLGGRGSVLQRDASLQGVRPRHSWGRTEEAAWGRPEARRPAGGGEGRASPGRQGEPSLAETAAVTWLSGGPRAWGPGGSLG